MSDSIGEILTLRRRMRLESIFALGILCILAMSSGGADAIATALVTEADAWKIRTKKVDGSLQDRLVVTTDVDVAKIRVVEANVELAQQGSQPATTTAGALWYDSSIGRLKYRNSSAWVEVEAPTHLLVRKSSDESVTSSTTLQDDDELKFAIGANEKWVADFWIAGYSSSGTPDMKVAINIPSGATVTYWVVTSPSSQPSSGDLCSKLATSPGTAFVCPLDQNGPHGYMVHVSVSNSTTAGDVVLQWAQNTSNATATTVKAGSSLEATRIP